jgi:hypothetical protein
MCVALCLLAGAALAQPESVPRLVDRHLDRASYVELARQWKAYIEEHGETVEALVNLGMAYNYSDENEAAMVAARRAVELGPADPAALAFLGKMVLVIGDDEDEALKILEHCRGIAPDHETCLTTLCATYLRRGQLKEAADVMRAFFDQRIIARPLQDFAWNMLVALPEGAVLITGGDNDTFPPLALQAGMDFRTDVIVINRSLLNVPGYAEAIFDHHPEIRPDYNIEGHEVKTVDGRPTLLSFALIDRMVEENKAPVYYATSVGPSYGWEPDGDLEGINRRPGKRSMTAEESARLFLETYRLDSATDWSFPWTLKPQVANLLQNYVGAMIRLAEEKGVSKETRAQLLDKAAAIADFHDFDRLSIRISGMKEQ